MDKRRNKFGFDLMQVRDLSMAGAWGDSVDVLKAIEPSLVNCITCGGCAAACAASANVSVATAILLLRRGLLADARAALEGCLFCGKCRFVCPMGVNTRGVIAALTFTPDSSGNILHQ